MSDIPSKNTILDETAASASTSYTNLEEVASSSLFSIMPFSIPKPMSTHLTIPQLADYIIPIEPFEVGGQGFIYRAENKKGGQFVIIKVTSGLTAGKYITRFDQETKALFTLRNINNVVNILWSFHTPMYGYILMEYIDGISLENLSNQQRKFTSEALLETLRQFCVALNAIHSNAIIHRDISPSNVMVNKDGILKVIDFGLCRIQSDKTENVTQGSGWLNNYTAPEMNMNPSYNYKVDLYSAAITVGIMFTNWVPYQMIDSILTFLQTHTCISLLFEDMFQILREKQCDDRIIVILENWLKLDPRDRIESKIWLNMNHFPDPLEKALYVNEIFKMD